MILTFMKTNKPAIRYKKKIWSEQTHFSKRKIGSISSTFGEKIRNKNKYAITIRQKLVQVNDSPLGTFGFVSDLFSVRNADRNVGVIRR